MANILAEFFKKKICKSRLQPVYTGTLFSRLKSEILKSVFLEKFRINSGVLRVEEDDDKDGRAPALPAVLPKVHHSPEKLYLPTEINTPPVDGLARIPGYANPIKAHSHPLKIVPSFPSSEPPKHGHSQQSLALSTNTQGSQGEKKG